MSKGASSLVIHNEIINFKKQPNPRAALIWTLDIPCWTLDISPGRGGQGFRQIAPRLIFCTSYAQSLAGLVGPGELDSPGFFVQRGLGGSGGFTRILIRVNPPHPRSNIRVNPPHPRNPRCLIRGTT